MEGHLEVILIQNIAMRAKLTKEQGRNFVKSDVIGMVLVQSLWDNIDVLVLITMMGTIMKQSSSLPAQQLNIRLKSLS